LVANSIEIEDSGRALTDLLRGYSAEVTPGDRKSIIAAKAVLQAGSEVFIASLPTDSSERQLIAAVELRRAGLTPIPHIAARNIANVSELDNILGKLADHAGVDSALILAGDRDQPAGKLHSSLQVIESGLLSKHGIRRVLISAYPEGHPRIPPEVLASARAAKLVAAQSMNLDVTLVSQFCFDSVPIIAFAAQLRAEGVTVPLRIGVAGPASRTSLLKYALICGVGASVRALKERQGTARNMFAGETPKVLLTEVALAQASEPALGISGVHFFTFASLAATAQWVDQQCQDRVNG
jgi:methylenetetrahydrofolate reductase (NADPH)